MVCHAIRRLRFNVLPADSLAQVPRPRSARCPVSPNHGTTVAASRTKTIATITAAADVLADGADQGAALLRVVERGKSGLSSQLVRKRVPRGSTTLAPRRRLDRLQKPCTAADSSWFISFPCTLISVIGFWFTMLLTLGRFRIASDSFDGHTCR